MSQFAAEPPFPPVAAESWVRRLATDAVVLATLTGIGYWVAFAYESGFASHFGYPTYLISPSLNVILPAIAAIAATLAALMPAALDFLKRRKPSLRKTWLWFALGLLTLFFTTNLFISSNYDWKVFWRIPFAIVVYIVFTLSAVSDAKEGVALSRSASIGALVLFAAVFTNVASTFMGMMAAKDQKVFYFLVDNPEYAVVRLYDGLAIAVRYDASKKTFVGDYRAMKVGDEPKELRLKRTAILETRLPVMKSGEP